MTIVGRLLLMEDNLRLKTTFDRQFDWQEDRREVDRHRQVSRQLGLGKQGFR